MASVDSNWSSQDIEYCTSFMTKLNELREQELLCDTTLCVEKRDFPCHKAMLAASSPYFQSIFTLDMNEKNKSCITLHNIPVNLMEPLLTYMYTGSVFLDEDKAKQFIFAADYLLLEGLKQIASRYLAACLNYDNVISFIHLAEKYSCSLLIESSKEFLLENFTEVSYTREFLELSSEWISELYASDQLAVNREEEVFETLIRWIKHNPNERENDFANLFRLVRLTNLPRKYLLLTVVQNQYVVLRPWCHSKVLKIATGNHFALSSDGTSKQRKSTVTDAILVVGGFSLMDKTFAANTLQCFIPDGNRWYVLPPMLTPRYALASAVLNQKMYCVGGRIRGGQTTSIVECFDLQTCKWKEVMSMNTASCIMGACFHKNLLYVVGGRTRDSSHSNIVQRYDPDINLWQYVKSLNMTRFGVCAVSTEEHLYAIGGQGDGNEVMNSVERYDDSADTWQVVADMYYPRFSAHGIYANEKIYVIAGFQSECEMYDPGIDQWKIIANCHQIRYCFGSALIGKFIYILGGMHGEYIRKTVERYDVEKDEWIDYGTMPDQLATLQACAVQMPNKAIKFLTKLDISE